MWKSLRESKDLVAAASLAQILQALLPLIGIVAPIASIYLFKLPTASFVTGGLGATFLFSFYLFMRTTRSLRRKFAQDLNPNLVIVGQVKTCRIISPEHIEYDHDVEFKAVANDVIAFNHKFHWTGAGEVEIMPRSAGCTVVKIPLPTLPHNIVRMVFNRPFVRGKSTHVRFTIITKGVKDVQRPYYALDVRYFGKKAHDIKLVVDFSRCRSVERAWRESYSSADAQWPTDDPEQIDVGATPVVEWVLPHDDGRRHAICWDYIKSGSPNA